MFETPLYGRGDSQTATTEMEPPQKDGKHDAQIQGDRIVMSIREYDDMDDIQDEEEEEVNDVKKEEDIEVQTVSYISTNYCTSCKGARGRPGIHCRFNPATKKFIDTCSKKTCGCRCRRQFIGSDGKWHNIFKSLD